MMSDQDWAVREQVSLSRHSPDGVKVTMSGQDWAVWEQVSLSRVPCPGTHLSG
jgi:hypothetical protein